MQWQSTFWTIDLAACIIPLYTCSPVTWNASRALIVSRGYVRVTAVTPADEPATNFPASDPVPKMDPISWK